MIHGALLQHLQLRKPVMCHRTEQVPPVASHLFMGEGVRQACKAVNLGPLSLPTLSVSNPGPGAGRSPRMSFMHVSNCYFKWRWAEHSELSYGEFTEQEREPCYLRWCSPPVPTSTPMTLLTHRAQAMSHLGEFLVRTMRVSSRGRRREHPVVVFR